MYYPPSTVIREKKGVLNNEEDILFGEEFREFILEHVKSKKKKPRRLSIVFQTKSGRGGGRFNQPFRTAVEQVGGNHHNLVSCFLKPAEYTGVNQKVQR